MDRQRAVLVGIAVVLGVWMVFDGGRALIVGSYVTPATGEYAGQLGPWSDLVRAIGLDPTSAGVKLVHVLCGGLWLLAAAANLARRPSRRPLTLAASVASLWYLPFGTLGGVAAIYLGSRRGDRPLPASGTAER